MFERVSSFLYPAITFVVLIAIWQLSIDVLHVPDYILPRPMMVLESLKAGYIDGEFWPHFLFTLRSTVSGYLIGCGCAIVIGAVLAESPTFEKFVYPYVIALQSMPKVALAPLIIVWFGYGFASKLVMVALICFFPCFVNTSIGLKSYNPELIDLYRAMGASRWQIFWRVKVPSAAGHIFAGLQISVVLALLGTVVAELVASRRGLGHVIAAAGLDFDVAMMFACVVILATIGVLASQLIQLIHRRVVFWESRSAATTVVAR